MSSASPALHNLSERRLKRRDATRAGILDAARKVAKREGAARLSLRSVALEAGFAPAALYVYFQSKDDLMLALAAEDLARLVREMQAASKSDAGAVGPRAAVAAALTLLSKTETLAAAAAAMNSRAESRATRLFNGRLIAALSALSATTGTPAETREKQADVLLMAGTLIGLALLVRSGRLDLLGFTPDEILARLPQAAGSR